MNIYSNKYANNYFMELQSNMEEWRDVFWLSAAVLISTNLVFLQFGSGDVQPWNEKANEQYQTTDIANENNVASVLKPL